MNFYSSLYRIVRKGLINKVKLSRDVKRVGAWAQQVQEVKDPSHFRVILTALAMLTLPRSKSKPSRVLLKTTISLKPFLISSPCHLTHPQKCGVSSPFHSFRKHSSKVFASWALHRACSGYTAVDKETQTSASQSSVPRAPCYPRWPSWPSVDPLRKTLSVPSDRALLRCTVTCEFSLALKSRLFHGESCSMIICRPGPSWRA